MNFSIWKMIFDSIYYVHTLNNISDRTESDNEKFGHVANYFVAKVVKIGLEVLLSLAV